MRKGFTLSAPEGWNGLIVAATSIFPKVASCFAPLRRIARGVFKVLHAETSNTSSVRKIIRRPAVEEQTGLSPTTIWREEKAGRFPKRIQITANAVGWYQDEITAWVHARIRGAGKAPSLIVRQPGGKSPTHGK